MVWPEMEGVSLDVLQGATRHCPDPGRDIPVRAVRIRSERLKDAVDRVYLASAFSKEESKHGGLTEVESAGFR